MPPPPLQPRLAPLAAAVPLPAPPTPPAPRPLHPPWAARAIAMCADAPQPPLAARAVLPWDQPAPGRKAGWLRSPTAPAHAGERAPPLGARSGPTRAAALGAH